MKTAAATNEKRRPVHQPWFSWVADKTGLVISYLHDKFIHMPIELLANRKKSMDPDGFAWSAVLAATGQPERFE